MDRLDFTDLHRQSERLRRDVQEARGLAEIEPRLMPVFGWLVHRDAVMRAQRGDALARPTVAMTCDKAIPVQDAGDEIVTGDEHKLANGGKHIR